MVFEIEWLSWVYGVYGIKHNCSRFCDALGVKDMPFAYHLKIRRAKSGEPIEFTDEAIEDIYWFKKHEQNVIIDGIEANFFMNPLNLSVESALLPSRGINTYFKEKRNIYDVLG